MSGRSWKEKKTDKEKAIPIGELYQNGDFIALSSLRERKKKKRREREREHLEEHEIVGVCCSTVLEGDTSSDSAFLCKASPTREFSGIHKRVRSEWWAEESTCPVSSHDYAQIRSRNF